MMVHQSPHLVHEPWVTPARFRTLVREGGGEVSAINVTCQVQDQGG